MSCTRINIFFYTTHTHASPSEVRYHSLSPQNNSRALNQLSKRIEVPKTNKKHRQSSENVLQHTLKKKKEKKSHNLLDFQLHLETKNPSMKQGFFFPAVSFMKTPRIVQKQLGKDKSHKAFCPQGKNLPGSRSLITL